MSQQTNTVQETFPITTTFDFTDHVVCIGRTLPELVTVRVPWNRHNVVDNAVMAEVGPEGSIVVIVHFQCGGIVTSFSSLSAEGRNIVPTTTET